ncbi:MAG: hypothetical protein WDN03_05590 [Rhizomicrobium sp.]
MSDLRSDADQSVPEPAGPEGIWGGARRIGDIRQWLGTSGALSGTNGAGRLAFLYAVGFAALLVGIVNVLNVITWSHAEPQASVLGPVIWEGTSWVAFMAFIWIPWIAFRLAPPLGRPRWRLLAVHPAGAVLFAIGHVGGFVLLRKLIYWLAGDSYQFGALGPHFLYEFSKDALGYVAMIASFGVIERLLEAPAARPAGEVMFTIRDGAKITRVAIRDILAVNSAGNYVEFALRDGRRLLMRSPLSAIETELGPARFRARAPLLAGQRDADDGAEARGLRRLYGRTGRAQRAAVAAVSRSAGEAAGDVSPTSPRSAPGGRRHRGDRPSCGGCRCR